MDSAAMALMDANPSKTHARPGREAHVGRLEAMFSAHFELVWRSVRRFGVPEDAADDATQEVFIVASRKLERIEAGKERAFLLGTAVRVASDFRRARKRRRDRADDESVSRAAAQTPAPDDAMEHKQAREMLQKIVDAMPDDQRSVFVLFELEGITMAAIAQCLELPPGTVASRLRRARKTFRAAVAALERQVSHG